MPRQLPLDPARPPNHVLVVELAVVLLLGYFPHLVGAVVWYGHEWPGTFAEDMITLSCHSLQIVAPVLYITWRSGEGWTAFGLGKPEYLTDGVLALMVFGLAVILSSWTAGYIEFHDRIGEATDEATLLVPSGVVDYGLMVVAMIFNSLSEELVMRGYLITRLRQFGANAYLAVVASAMLFASYHIYQGVTSTTSAMVFGLIFGGAFALTGRLWPLIVAHTVYNLFVYTSS